MHVTEREIIDGTDQRQTCCVCTQSVGRLPNGETVAYRTERMTFSDGQIRRFHYCIPNHCDLVLTTAQERRAAR